MDDPGAAHLIDMHAAADRLGTTHRHLRRLVAERRVPYVKVGRYVRFDPVTLNQWAVEQTVQPPVWARRTRR